MKFLAQHHGQVLEESQALSGQDFFPGRAGKVGPKRQVNYVIRENLYTTLAITLGIGVIIGLFIAEE